MIIFTNKIYNRKYQKILTDIFDILQLSGSLAAELEFISLSQMHELNLSARGKDYPTDVLSFGFLSLVFNNNYPSFTKESFPLDFIEELNSVFIGSIVICKEVAKKQAEEYGQTLEEEITYLLVHGLLHLLGYDHEISEENQKIMRTLEEKILCRN